VIARSGPAARPRCARISRAVLLGAALALSLGCGSAARQLEKANALRVAGQHREALAAYQLILADLGDAPLAGEEAEVRQKALRHAADVSYLELGDYTGAIAYYRRIISLYPASEPAWEARGIIGDIYRDRFKDHLAAIAQYADIAASESAQAPRYQLEVARAYLALRNYEQARTEARLLRERWPDSEASDEAQLLTAQAWALEKREEEALGAFQATIDRRPKPGVAARALEGQAHLYAQMAITEGDPRKVERALELYALALPNHPNPDTVRTAIEAVRRRRDAARPAARPGDRNAALDKGVAAHPQETR
jgi:tetratricopeptide (TPR) repeat protein